MSKIHDLQVECARHLTDMIRLMKDKVGYDEDDMVFLLQHWVRAGVSFPYPVGDPKEYGKNYPRLFKSYLARVKVSKDAQLSPNPKEEDPEAGEKASVFLFRRLNWLSNHVYVDNGWGYLNFHQTESALLRMLWNYRVVLTRTDPKLGGRFDQRLRSLLLV